MFYMNNTNAEKNLSITNSSLLNQIDLTILAWL